MIRLHAASRRGFSLVEMMLVVVVMGMLLIVGLPAFRRSQRDAALASGRNALAAVISRARTVAISRGAPTAVRFGAGHQRVEMLLGGTWQLVGDTLHLEQGFGVLFTVPGDIRFLPTGMALLPGGGEQVTLSVLKGDRARTLRLTRYGRIQ